jgi:ubiquinone/menaquinone biosynthesis C-methylase UbiE
MAPSVKCVERASIVQGTPAKSDLSATSFATEEARLRQVYAGRKRNQIYSAFEPAHLFGVQERERKLLALLARRGLTSLKTSRILEVGCGNGGWLLDFVRWGATPENIAGVDLLPERIARARHLCPAGIALSCGNATRLQAEDGSFDLVLQSAIFTSILDPEMKRQIAREMLRVLRPSGCIIWYDFHMNNPWNPDVRGIKRGEIAALFPGCKIALRRLTLAPPLGRPIARVSPLLYRLLSEIKPFCSHYLGIIRRAE